MTEKHKYIASLDIGTSKIIASLAYIRPDNQIEVVGLSKKLIKAVKRGIIISIEETVQAIKSTIKDIFEQTGIGINQVNVNISGQHIEMIKKRGSINIKSNDSGIRTKDITDLTDSMYKTPIEDDKGIIQVIPVEYIVDNKPGIINPTGITADKLEADFHIIVGQLAAINNVKKCVKLAGAEINKIAFGPVASSLPVLSNEEKEKGVVLVDIGAGTTDIAVYCDNRIRHIAVIPFGGNTITSDLKEVCNILSPQAEALKVHSGSALAEFASEDETVTIPGVDGRGDVKISKKKIACKIQFRLEEIIDAILYEIESSGFSDKLEAGIVLTGGSSMIKNIDQLIKNKTGLDVRLGLPGNTDNNEKLLELNSPVYSTSVGLLMVHPKNT